jgi:hypothetical protein
MNRIQTGTILHNSPKHECVVEIDEWLTSGLEGLAEACKSSERTSKVVGDGCEKSIDIERCESVGGCSGVKIDPADSDDDKLDIRTA